MISKYNVICEIFLRKSLALKLIAEPYFIWKQEFMSTINASFTFSSHRYSIFT